jgi:hypothetical protein
MAAINPGDTAWVLVSAALVMFMTPGLGLFYGGLVRRKNVLSTVMHSFFVLCLISVQWVLWGYSLAFGPDFKGWGIIGDLSWVGLKGIGLAPNPDYAPTIPQLAFVTFQMMFAIITPALITGAFAERKRFKAFVIFSLLWATIVYDPIAHWVWGHGGWLGKAGTLDFAGGTVVEIASGSSALIAAWVLGKRILHVAGEEAVEPHNVTLVVLGTAILWFGWFGFNAGSALAANGIAVAAFLNTNTAGDPDRASRRRDLLRCRAAARSARRRRRTRRLGVPRRRRAHRHVADRIIRDDSGQRESSVRLVLRQPRTARNPSLRRGLYVDLRIRRDLRVSQSRELLRSPARQRSGGSDGPRPLRARRNRICDLTSPQATRPKAGASPVCKTCSASCAAR